MIWMLHRDWDRMGRAGEVGRKGWAEGVGSPVEREVMNL
jgi:hypothetical protein